MTRWAIFQHYRYERNHAYDNLGKTAKDYTEIVRAFKAKYPEKFAEVAESYDVRNHLALPSEINLFINDWVSNTDEAQRLIRANENISQSAYRHKPGWITIDQATAGQGRSRNSILHHVPASGFRRRHPEAHTGL
jgi:hypothetical protein